MRLKRDVQLSSVFSFSPLGCKHHLQPHSIHIPHTSIVGEALK